MVKFIFPTNIQIDIEFRDICFANLMISALQYDQITTQFDMRNKVMTKL